MGVCQTIHAQSQPYNISNIPHESGIYFENQGPLRLTNSDWKLLIYINLDNFNIRHKETINYYNKTVKICENLEKEHPEVFNSTSGNFMLTSDSLFREINRKRLFMLQSIDIERLPKEQKEVS